MRIVRVLLTVALAASAEAQEHPFEIAQKANAASAAGRHAEAADLFKRVTEMLPRSTGARINRAAALARAGKPAEALDQLAVAVDFGVRFNPADEAWNTIRADARLKRLESQMRARTAPILRSTVAFRLDKELIPENVAYDSKSGAFFVGSMYKAKIVRIVPDGTVTDFIPSRRDGLLSVLGMKIDAARRDLWAAAGNFVDRPPMQVEDPATEGKGVLFRFNVDSGKLLGVYRTPDAIQFNDLVIAPEGDVYATSGLKGIWRIRAGSDSVEQFIAPPGSFFNGVAITPDGKTLFAASHFEGVMKIDLATKQTSILNVPPGVALGGIDGLYVHDGSLVAVQNGTDPVRVIRAWMNPEMTRVTRFAVLEQEHPESDLPLTGTIVGDDLYYVARSQLRAFEGKKIWPAEKLKDSIVLKLPLEVAAAPAPDLAAEREELMEIHRAEIRAHIELNAKAIAERHADDFVSASRGKISRTSREQALAFFTNYFKGASYPLYEDAEPPIIRISDDASMAWILSRLRVRRLDEGKESGFVYAGMMVYEKRDGRWMRVANASTFE